MRALRPTLGLLALGALLASPLGAQRTVRASRALDRADLDTTCAACADFYRFANGGWVSRASIPASLPMWGTVYEVMGRTDTVLHALAERARLDRAAPAGSDRRKLGLFYGTCLDSARAEADGIAPIEPELRRVAAIATNDEVVREIIALRRAGQGVLFGFGADRDPKNSAEVIAMAAQGGLGLPDRDYYTRSDVRSEALRDAYVAHVARFLELSGESAGSARSDAASVMALEQRLAAASLSRVQRRDPNATYHKLAIAELQALTPHLDWKRFLAGAGAPSVAVVNVDHPPFFAAMDSMLATVPVATWKAYLRLQVVAAAAPWLSSRVAAEAFAWERRFSGATAQPPRWKRCLDQVNRGTLSEMLGHEYVRAHFPPEAKARVTAMVKDLEAVLRERIQNLDWMSEPTKREALAKLASFRVKVGYPDKWRDFSALSIEPGSFVANRRRVAQWSAARNLERIGRPVDDEQWSIPPQMVDAFALDNEIVFPAGILQPPWFDPDADDAVNYGAIGATIGHEMTHHFDDGGRRFDANGNLRDWWTPRDAANYEARAKLVVDQFDGYTVVDSATHVNGKLTLGENIADLGGAKIAYEALQKALARKGRPATIDGFTPEQRFFLAYALVWRNVSRPEFQRTRVNTDPHAPWMWRVNGPLSNMPEFAKAFGCRAGDPMVRPDSIRAQIW